MNPLTIAFVHAPLLVRDQSDGALFGPLWAYTLAAYVPEPWVCTVVDGTRQDASMAGPATVFAFSGTNQDLEAIRRVFTQLKRRYPQAVFVLGGPITWSLEQEGKLGAVDFFDRIFLLDGEETLPAFLRHVERGTMGAVPKVIRGERFPLSRARAVPFDLYRKSASRYYGAAIEVSRGCPFLCEFCDVRVLPGNNESNDKDPALVVREIAGYVALGVTQFVFVCDNFIGDVAWARSCVDAILQWQAGAGVRLSIFTWATVNIAKHTDLMRKMRMAGFSVLYIGIESVNANALLETAKVQNRVALRDAVIAIQSFGFIVTPGFIFGFDSDAPDVFSSTLAFIIETGLIAGDPSFLTAMPGTPLWDRMKRTRRLVEPDAGVTSRTKIATNVRYLLDARFLATGFVRFVEELTGPRAQWARFRSHVRWLRESDAYVSPLGRSHGRASRSLVRFVRLQLAHRATRDLLRRRAAYVVRRPARALTLAAGWVFAAANSRRDRDLTLHFRLWAYFWTSVGLRYRELAPDDLVLHSVGEDFDVASLVEAPAPEVDVPARHLVRGEAKARLQSRHTREGLRRLVASLAAAQDGLSTLADAPKGAPK